MARTAVASSYQFPPLTPDIGAGILDLAAKDDFVYKSILLLMKDLGLPPPFDFSNHQTFRYQVIPTLDVENDEVPLGIRIKRSHSSTILSSTNTPSSLPLSEDFEPRTKMPKLEEDSNQDGEQEDGHEYSLPPQPVHLMPTTRYASGTRNTIDLTTEPVPSHSKERSPSLQSIDQVVQVEIVPFELTTSADRTKPAPTTFKFISIEELAANRMSIERTSLQRHNKSASLPFPTWIRRLQRKSANPCVVFARNQTNPSLSRLAARHSVQQTVFEKFGEKSL